jgi:hypothetical protein
MPNRTPAEKAADELAAQARAEARSGGTDAPPTDAMKQKIADIKAEKAAEKAPTTRSSMGDSILKLGLETMKNSKPVEKKAKGGVTRADGCITKGHTKGRMV